MATACSSSPEPPSRRPRAAFCSLPAIRKKRKSKPATSADDDWRPGDREPRYLPLQVRPGDMAIFLLKNAVEIKYNGEKFFIVPQSGILMVERDEF